MAGKWERTKTAGAFVQGGRNGNRYKAALRDARGVVTSKTISRIGQAQTFLAEKRMQRRTNTLPDVSQSGPDHVRPLGPRRQDLPWQALDVRLHEHRWRNHVQPALGKRRLDSLRRSHLETFYADVEARTSLDTRRKVQQVVHKMLAVAVRSEWIVRNPAAGIQMPQAEVQRQGPDPDQP